MLKRISVFLFGVVAYMMFFVTILYLIAFVGNYFVFKSIDTGTEASVVSTVVINLLLISLFAIQHTIMARPAFKEWFTKIVPKPMERSVFVFLASGILMIMFWQWQPNRFVIWETNHQALKVLLIGVSLTGWGILFVSSFLIDHFDLFGLRQVYLYLRGRDYTPPHFVERALYKKIRHPLMTGVLLGIWSTPSMTLGHLVLAIGLTSYILVGVTFEERDLIKAHGESYESYRRRTQKFFPLPKL